MKGCIFGADMDFVFSGISNVTIFFVTDQKVNFVRNSFSIWFSF